MRCPVLVFAFVSLALCGCKGSREKEAVGTWTASGASMTVAADKTFKNDVGPLVFEGVWSIDKDDVTFTPKTINGKTIEEVKAKIGPVASRFPEQAKQFLADIDKPNVMLLSADGKSMTTDKSKDTNAGPATTFTKSN